MTMVGGPKIVDLILGILQNSTMQNKYSFGPTMIDFIGPEVLVL